MRNPLSWRNVNTTITSNPNLALKIFQDSNNRIIGTIKDIYEREREANTIDAMEKIRNGEPIGTDYGGIIDRKALLDFKIKNDNLKQQQELNALKRDQLRQIMELNSRKESRLEKMFPLELNREKLKMQNEILKQENEKLSIKSNQFKYNHLQDAYDLNRQKELAIIDLNKARAEKARRLDAPDEIEKYKLEMIKRDNEARKEYMRLSAEIDNAIAEEDYDKANRLTQERDYLRNDIRAMTGNDKGLSLPKDKLNHFMKIGYDAFTNTVKEVPLTEQEKIDYIKKQKGVLSKEDYLNNMLKGAKGSLRKSRESRIKKRGDELYNNYLLKEIEKRKIKETKEIKYVPTAEEIAKSIGENPYDSEILSALSTGLDKAKLGIIAKATQKLKTELKAMKDNVKRTKRINNLINQLQKKHDIDRKLLEIEFGRQGLL